MTSIAIALMLMLAPGSADPAASARKAFAMCIGDFVRTNVSQKIDADKFDGSIATACSDKEAAFKSAMVAFGAARGMSRKDAESSAAADIADYRSDAKDTFHDSVAPAKSP